MDQNQSLTRIHGLIEETYSLAGQVDFDQNTAVRILFDLTDAVEELDRWMSRGAAVPTRWMSQTRIDRTEPMMCCGEPMAVFPTSMGTAFNDGQDCTIVVWHCSECNHWEPYEPYPVEPEATVPNCLCGADMVDLPPSQWEPAKFRVLQCTECGQYDTWWPYNPIRHYGNEADGDPQEPRS